MKPYKDKKEKSIAEEIPQYVKASYALKRKIIDLVSNGRISKNAASKKYHVSRITIGYRLLDD